VARTALLHPALAATTRSDFVVRQAYRRELEFAMRISCRWGGHPSDCIFYLYVTHADVAGPFAALCFGGKSAICQNPTKLHRKVTRSNKLYRLPKREPIYPRPGSSVVNISRAMAGTYHSSKVLLKQHFSVPVALVEFPQA
jgi:hypothetical protein